jgi:hypothetical protein
MVQGPGVDGRIIIKHLKVSERAHCGQKISHRKSEGMKSP